MALAIFDLDHTLLATDSDHAWGEYLVNKNKVDKDLFKQKNDMFYQHYQQGTLNIFEYLEFALQPLKNIEQQELLALRAAFIETEIKPKIAAGTAALLKKHRAAGDFLLIITATNSFITQPIAELLGVDYLIGTDPEMVNGLYTGKVAGTPAFQAGKVKRLKTWLLEQKFDLVGSYFYSDSRNDIPLLELVDNPVAVDPDATLEQHARTLDWPVISLRH